MLMPSRAHAAPPRYPRCRRLPLIRLGPFGQFMAVLAD